MTLTSLKQGESHGKGKTPGDTQPMSETSGGAGESCSWDWAPVRRAWATCNVLASPGPLTERVLSKMFLQ